MTLKEYRKKIGQGVNEKNKYIKNLFSRIFLSITLLLSILILSVIIPNAFSISITRSFFLLD